MQKLLFFLGKGGVGKSTASSLTSVYLAEKKYKVVLISIDPAHNLSDIFETPFSDIATEIKTGLKVIEIDQDKWIRKYLKDSEQQFSKAYSYLTAFSLDKHFSVMQHAPGIEEYALLMAFNTIVKKYSKHDFLIFDMPPTALALKFFALPQISLFWLGNLMKIRREISKKQKIISTLSLGNKSIERDRVIENIENQILFWNEINSLFQNEKITFPLLVQNPDKLSAAEGERIIQKLSSVNMPQTLPILNRSNVIKGMSFILNIPKLKSGVGFENLLKSLKKIDFLSLMQKLEI
ncbi:MAG: ArsA family ATPase [Calditrichaeota bacterium]|nr:MAG: ArsA family ATPase [Calditrichota bacterium]MBL1204682.1 ArsA family ATPase [Calditrichota bacterium]NOG44510.1 ArsA family ATPase [Calditrichota bacterium]